MTSENSDVDLRIWGKSKHLCRPYPLLWHLVDTAAVVEILWGRFLTPNQRRIIADGLGVSDEHAKLLAMFWAGLHDVGKATPGFQSMDGNAFEVLRQDPAYGTDTGSRSLRHERAAHIALPEILKTMGYSARTRVDLSLPHRIAQMLGGHHGRFQRTARRDSDERYLGGGAWAAQRSALVRALHEAVGSPQPPNTVASLSAVLVTGLIILADWLASQEHFLRQQAPTVPQAVTATSVAAHLAGLRPKAEVLLTEAGLGLPTLRSKEFQDIFPFPPNALQQSLIGELIPKLTGPGLLIVTAAMGDGKTEAALIAALALAAASGSSGLYFALPTMATSDQMYGRVLGFASRVADGPSPVTLLHSMSWLNAEYEKRCSVNIGESRTVSSDDQDTYTVAPGWLRARKRGILAPLSVGTIDQALLMALTTKHNALRLLGLTGKVFVVDEAHAYDEYMQTVLRRLLVWLGAARCPVVLLSATLPSTVSAKLADAYRRGATSERARVAIDYPGWTFIPADSDQEPSSISAAARAEMIVHRSADLKLDVRPVHHRDGPEMTDPRDRRAVLREVLSPLLENIKKGGCAAVMCNTVNDAQLTYESLYAWAGGKVDLVLLHSRFPARRREELTELITGRLGRTGSRKTTIVVATQVIEQSLDLDFDVVISDLAPMAQLIQRAGRCQRHKFNRPQWAEKPRLVVLDPHSDDTFRMPANWQRVYVPYLLRATHLRLRGLDEIRIPQDVQEHMEAIYVDPPVDEDPQLIEEYAEYRGEDLARCEIAKLGVIPEVNDLRDLADLSEYDLAESQVSTRLGADSARLVCCFIDADGRQWLDPERRQPLPDKDRYSTADVRAVLAESIPVPVNLLEDYEAPHPLPSSWQENAWLNELRALWFRLSPEGTAPVEYGKRRAWLDPDLGLVVRG